MKSTVVTRFTTDSVPQWHPLTRDEVLEANKAHKSIASGLVWDGDLRPKLDMLIEQAAELHGFMVNHVVGPEPSPVVNQMLGRVWRGVSDMSRDLKRTSVADDDLTDAVDTSEALAAVEQLRQALGTEQISMSAVHDRIAKLKRARDAVGRRGSNRGTNDANWAANFLTQARGLANAAIAKMRESTKPSASGATTHDSHSEVRDRLHAANKATSAHEQVRALNAVNTAFWAERRYTPTNDARIPVDRVQSSPKTMAEMNERNRAFWAGRK